MIYDYKPEWSEKTAKKLRGRNLTKEHKNNISSALKGVPKTPEHNKKVGDANRGKKRSSECKGKMSERMRGKRFRAIQIIQYDMDMNYIKQFSCIRDAQRELGIIETAINNCLKGRAKSAGGFIWRYLDKDRNSQLQT